MIIRQPDCADDYWASGKEGCGGTQGQGNCSSTASKAATLHEERDPLHRTALRYIGF